MDKDKKKELKKLELTPFERILIINMLPRQASRHIGMLIEQIKDTLSLTDEEVQAYNVKYLQGGGAEFGNNGRTYTEDNHPAYIETRSFEFTEQKYNIIKNSFKRADNEERLPVSKRVHSLYDKVVT